ncbi:sulfide/dihydroorotate dehydrogenase-like FAD/NAD-binding protein [bacterium]|nr:sulfide/dihydroorotate dehydrogenase-like FAD/NAD-binding protein [bacterium]
MFTITAKKQIAPQVWQYSVHAPEIASKRKAGNFVILRPTAESERIPLTIVDSDPLAGTIDIIFQVVGATTFDLAKLESNQSILDMTGPLGQATHIEKYGTCVMIGGGVGIAPLLPIAKAFQAAGNTLVGILGSRSKDYLILEEELRTVSQQLIITTDDGSQGEKALVTGPLKRLLDKGDVDFVLAVGPVVMMKAVAEITRPYQVKTMVSLNPIMIDGTGMCGVCRCQVDGKTRFACVDGPEFDGHTVDFDGLSRRLRMYQQEEKEKMEAKKA